MPIYPFRCNSCGSTASEYFPMKDGPSSFPHNDCGIFERTWTVPATPKPFVPHFNVSVGRHVSSLADFKSALRQGSQEASDRTGVDHHYEMIEPDAHKEVGVTDGGEAEREATLRASPSPLG